MLFAGHGWAGAVAGWRAGLNTGPGLDGRPVTATVTVTSHRRKNAGGLGHRDRAEP
ncbi:MAG TPA: hypothetical protein VGA36_09355 [Nitriliruptorales bacterium]